MNPSMKEIDSPLGTLTLVEEDGALTGMHFGSKKGTGYFSASPETPHAAAGRKSSLSPFSPLLERAAQQLAEYFAGERESFDLPLNPQGTEFQRAVWKALGGIGFGETVSYAHVAKKIGRPAAVRAVGAANGQNPIALIIPCHRVIGADGSLTGYGGGLSKKRWLLQHETRQRSMTL